MKVNYKYILIFLLLPFLAVANSGKKKGKYTKEKSYHQEYSVNSDASLYIKNNFGNVNITTWNQNKVVIDVKITVNGDNEKKVIAKLDDITVNFSGTQSAVEAITHINNKKWKSHGKLNLKIDYEVKAPRSNRLKLVNDYGNIKLNETDAVAMISCDYGKVFLGKLNASGNDINLDYSPGSSIEYMKSGNINADYSSYTLGKAERLQVDTDYTDSTIEEIGALIFNGDYGKLIINKANSIKVEADYLKIKIGSLEKEFIAETSYGNMHINDLSSNFERISVNGKYGNLHVNYSGDIGFKFDMKMRYGNLNCGDDFQFTHKEKKNFSKQYQGYVGGKGATVSVNLDYGNVKFYKK